MHVPFESRGVDLNQELQLQAANIGLVSLSGGLAVLLCSGSRYGCWRTERSCVHGLCRILQHRHVHLRRAGRNVPPPCVSGPTSSREADAGGPCHMCRCCVIHAPGILCMDLVHKSLSALLCLRPLQRFWSSLAHTAAHSPAMHVHEMRGGCRPFKPSAPPLPCLHTGCTNQALADSCAGAPAMPPHISCTAEALADGCAGAGRPGS